MLFSNIYDLTSVTFEGTTPPQGIEKDPFYEKSNHSNSFVIYVPAGSVEAYKKVLSNGYSKLGDKVRAKE